MQDVISLTQKLISFNTINPPGNEQAIAKFMGGILKKNGFKVEYPKFAESRLHVVAEYPGKGKPIVLSGHLDVVPLGNAKWKYDPFQGIVKNGKLYGRGSSDMKGAVAAMCIAAINVIKESKAGNGIKFILTASEENGCAGARQLVKSGFDLGEASAVIVGEPTANIPAIGHKGALFINARTKGITAHSSMPQEGENAIYKAARAITKLSDFSLPIEEDDLLGKPTFNVGVIKGGINPNSVPDSAEFSIDVRSTRKASQKNIIEMLQNCLGSEVVLKPFVDLGPSVTDEENSFIQLVYKITKFKSKRTDGPFILPYMTDASVLQKYYKNVPIVILGPGQPEQAHQTNEFCYVKALEKSVHFYEQIIRQWSEI